MKFLLNLLTTFNYVSPLVETGKDFNNMATGIHGTLDISVQKGDLRQAKKVIERTGYKVVSTTSRAFDDEELLSVECFGGVDGYDSIRAAVSALRAAGIQAGVYPYDI